MKVQLLVASAGLVLFSALPSALSAEVEKLQGNNVVNSFEYQLADFFSHDDEVGVGIPTTNDAAYIHRGCSGWNGAFPVYTNGAFGDGWYCNDGVDVSKMDPGNFANFDDAYIHVGCGYGVQYATSLKAWYCKDDPRPQSRDAIDIAYIHPGCSDAEYIAAGAFGFGAAWYCKDAKDITGWDRSDFDSAFIHTGCGSGVYYDGVLNAWYCKDDEVGVGIPTTNDAAYIHRGCSGWNGAFPVYTNGAFGDGWYCNDGVDVSKTDPGNFANFDDAYIHVGCDVGVQYANSLKAWYCKDDPRPQSRDAIDLAYIHRGCSDGAAYSNGAFGYAWYCNDGEDVSGWDPSAFDAAFIHSGCGSGVYYDGVLKAWYCKDIYQSNCQFKHAQGGAMTPTAAPAEDYGDRSNYYRRDTLGTMISEII